MLMHTHSGKSVILDQMNENDIKIEDIAYALSNLSRFAGNNIACNVAYHSLLVCEDLQERGMRPHVVLHGLLHDAHEAYTGEIPKGTKEFIRKEWFKVAIASNHDPITKLEERIDWAIRCKFDLPILSMHERVCIKESDSWICALEGVTGWHRHKRPSWVADLLNGKKPKAIEPKSAVESQELFILKFQELKKAK